jgi:S-adenosylmethionine decarboxylase
LAVGTHVLAELYGCPREKLETVDVVRTLLREVVRRARFRTLGESFHQFEPFGVTGVFVLKESHLSIHTWPEKNLAAVDIFTCGDEGNAVEGFEILRELFDPADFHRQVVER